MDNGQPRGPEPDGRTTPEDDRPVVERVRALLDQAISAGTLGTGDKIPTERALSDALRISRNGVRTALAQLEREGALVRHVGRGTFLTRPGAHRPTPAVAAVGTPAPTSPAEILATRLALEPEIAALAATAALPFDLDRIRHCMDRGNATTTYNEFDAWDLALHRAIATATHNGLLAGLFDTVSASSHLSGWGRITRRAATPGARSRHQDCHADILAALVDRDPDAAREQMHHHLLELRQDVLGA